MAAKSKKRSTKQTNKKKKQDNFIWDEIIIWVTLAVSILILISNFGLGGRVGGTIADALYNAFGLVAYLIPFLLFGAVSLLVSNKGNTTVYLKVLTSVFLMIFVCTFLELVDGLGGGTGAILTDLMVPLVGVAGTYVIDIICIIICIVIITGKSILKGVKTHSDKAYEMARADAARRKKLAQERQQAKAAMPREPKPKRGVANRAAKHVEGVSFDTTLGSKSPEIKEISAKPPVDDAPLFQINRADAMPTVTAPQSEVAPEQEIVPEVEETKTRGKRKEKLGATQMEQEVAAVASVVESKEVTSTQAYRYPPMSLLKKGRSTGGDSDSHLRETALKLQQTLQTFGVNVTVTNVNCGPSVTRYELQPEMGVKVSKIVGLADDIKLNLAAADIRIEAPIPGKAAVGIEVPNKESSAVALRDLLDSSEFKNSSSKIAFAAGKDISGKVVIADIAKMPHLLIAGATGSGKSVCINTLIMSILYEASPEEVRLIMIDPKVVELSVYNGIPHLLLPVVTDPKKAAGALNWAVAEMTRRYQAFADMNVRDMKGYNDKVASAPEIDGVKLTKMPQIVIIVDELADLMMVAPGEVEGAICRLAQLARAAGLHLVLATQRPSVNVITGLIKANMPSRIAFSVSSGVDSRTIIDMNGAEKLLGKGDMLFYPSGYQKPARVQGSFVSDSEVQSVVEYLKNHNGDASYDDEVVTHVNTASVSNDSGNISSMDDGDDRDQYFVEAGQLIIDKEKASIGMLQRSFKIGFNRAARIMDQLCEAGVVGGEEGTKPRKVLMNKDEFAHYVEENI